jgi:DNA-binding transcriptional LysR family regulator
MAYALHKFCKGASPAVPSPTGLVTFIFQGEKMPSIANVDLRLLRLFMTIVECGGFSAAQAVLNIGQSTISTHMMALEDRFRCKLCQRGRGGFELTNEGRVVYEAAKRLFVSLGEFQSETEALHGVLIGDLRIGVVDNTITDSRAPIANALRRFSARPNKVHVNLVVDSPPALQRQLIDRRIDAAIFGFAPRLPNLRYQNLYTESSALYCGAHHPLFKIPDNEVTLDDVRGFAFASRSYWCNQDMERLGITGAAATVEQMEAQLTLILSGAYLGFLPVHYAERWVEEGRLRPLLMDEVSYAVKFQLVLRKGVGATPILKAFIEDIFAAISTSNQGGREAPPKIHELCAWRSGGNHGQVSAGAHPAHG